MRKTDTDEPSVLGREQTRTRALLHLPLAGVLTSLVLFTLAASRFPGGYRVTRDFVSTLFAPVTASGAVNAARPLAVLSMLVFCASVAILFALLSRRAPDRWLASTLEIGGIGSMVYAFLIVTPLHDLLIGIALAFFLPAKLAALRLASLERRRMLLGAGVACLGLLLASAIQYYAHLRWDLLPLVQKTSLLACTLWLLALQRLSPPSLPGASYLAAPLGRVKTIR